MTTSSDRLSFLVGLPPLGADLDDLDTVALLFRERAESAEAWRGETGFPLYRQLLAKVLARQILEDDPPEVWQAVERMLAEGHGDDRIIRSLFLAAAHSFHQLAASDQADEADEADDADEGVLRSYLDVLAALPIPPAADVRSWWVEATRRAGAIGLDELRSQVVDRMLALPRPASGDDGEALWIEYADRIFDQLSQEWGSPLLLLAPDVVVDAGSLLAGATLTHRLSEEDLEHGSVPLQPHLALIDRLDWPLVDTGGDPLYVDVEDGRGPSLLLPEGCLDHAGPGQVLSLLVRGGAGGDGPAGSDGERGTVVAVAIEGDVPAPEPGLVAQLRAALEVEGAESGLPVAIEDVVARLLVEHPQALSGPHAPVGELLAAAGIEVRGEDCADSWTRWQAMRRVRRIRYLHDRLDDGEAVRAAMAVLELFDLDRPPSTPPLAGEASPAGEEGLAAARAALRDDEVLEFCAHRLVIDTRAPLVVGGSSEEQRADARARAIEIALHLANSARSPRDGAPARFIAARLLEDGGDLAGAEAELARANRGDPDLAPVLDRLAWYAFDRGDARRALSLLRRLDRERDDDVDVELLEEYAAPPGGGLAAVLGRNDPCWCGSGRKFKQCHLGAPAEHRLPERVRWLLRKVAWFVDHHRDEAFPLLFALVAARAGTDRSDEAIREGIEDPLVRDVLAAEGGWLERFVAARSPLLPGDEALLAQAWVLVDRSCYEVTDVRPGSGLTVRDLRSAELLEVRERSFSRAARQGAIYCARIVPDGESHQIVGPVIPVPPGREAELLDVLDDGDPEEIVSFVAALEAPPSLVTREGEPMVACRVEIAVADEDVALALLASRYEEEGDGAFVELHELASGDTIRRARLVLSGGQLVIETTSEERLERVLDLLRSELGELEVRSDERRRFDPRWIGRGLSAGAGAAPEAAAGGGDALDDQRRLLAQNPQLRQAMLEMRDRFEQAWCDEPVPALRGLTPRQAAADPAGREALDRLLADYGAHVDAAEDPELAMQHPDRLRRLLGLTGA